jgi:DNA mismatch repair protein MutS2
MPDLVEPDQPIRIRAGRHPLLAARGEVVPFDLELDSSERVLLISGPNAGGKTVLLKSVGLITALARSGVIPPVGPETKLPFFGGPFAIIGDEQSIEASLSTFGAQVRNLAEILREAGSGDLVLIDEIGSATDPAEGGALAAATLAALGEQVRLTIATTHLGDLKGLAEERTGTVNASLQFDADRLEPTFRLEKNRPGRSYALEIAARLGIPSKLLDDARARLDSDHQSLDSLLARLEREQAEIVSVREALHAGRDELERDAASLAVREEEMERRSLELERERVFALEAALREARQEVESAIARLEAQYASGGAAPDVRDARRATRDVVERRLRETRARRADLSDEGRPGAAGELTVGEAVTWGGSGRSGLLVEVRGDRGMVEIDGVRLTMPVADLMPTTQGESNAPGRRSISVDSVWKKWRPG